MRGKFIAIEGPDGSGKTTQASAVSSALRSSYGADAVTSIVEPSSDASGKLCRHWISSGAPAQALALAFAADRTARAPQILTTLAEGQHIVTDRYFLSSLVYQVADGCDKDWIEQINQHVVKPDIVIVLSAPLEALLKRISDRGDSDRYEEPSFLARVVEMYEGWEDPSRYTVNGDQSADMVTDDILGVLSETLEH